MPRWSTEQLADALRSGVVRVRSDFGGKPSVDAQAPVSRPVRRKSGTDPEAVLVEFIRQEYPDVQTQYRCVPGRKFTLDAALPDLKIAIELDGWEYHGKHKSDFHRDREKRNALAAAGWLVFAFPAKTVLQSPGECLQLIDRAVRIRRAER